MDETSSAYQETIHQSVHPATKNFSNNNNMGLFKCKLLQFLASGFIINMTNAMYPESGGHLYKQGPVFNIYYLPGVYLGCIQCNAENIGIGFSEMNKTGHNKKISHRI